MAFEMPLDKYLFTQQLQIRFQQPERLVLCCRVCRHLRYLLRHFPIFFTLSSVVESEISRRNQNDRRQVKATPET